MTFEVMATYSSKGAEPRQDDKGALFFQGFQVLIPLIGTRDDQRSCETDVRQICVWPAGGYTVGEAHSSITPPPPPPYIHTWQHRISAPPAAPPVAAAPTAEKDNKE